eukprot:augustus_masked-scaffold_2-processed-gene-6.43-mRNA-1 protein AED:0.11 eAED:1.00 QI:0/-1/0/1/-1/1/1/0/417
MEGSPKSERAASMASLASRTLSRASLNFGKSSKSLNSPRLSRLNKSQSLNHSSNAHLSSLGFFPSTTAPNPARVQHSTYFPDPTGQAYLEGKFTIRVLKQKATKATPNGTPEQQRKKSMNFNINMRASLMRWKKYKASIKLIDGAILFVISGKRGGPTVTWLFQIGQLANIGYKRKGAKDFSLAFLNDDQNRIINIQTENEETATRWIVGIFGELRVEAKTFGIIRRELVDKYPVWKKLFDGTKNTDVTYSADDVQLTDEEEKGLIMSETDGLMLERSLREEVDLYVLCSGYDHPDTCDAYDNLAIFLRRQFRTSESDYWLGRSEAGRKNYRARVKADMNLSAMPLTHLGMGERTVLEDLRNPGGMTSNAEVFTAQKQHIASVDVNKRVDIVKEELSSAGAVHDSPSEKKDAFEDLL